MPTYDYQCGACSHKFELFQGITEKPRRKCPECGKPKLRRLISGGAAVLFKGSGFYQTDYRSESYKKGAEAAKKATEGGAKAPAQSESKTDASKSSKSESSRSDA